MVNTITECDKLRKNTIVVNGIRELAMNEATAYQKKEIKHERMKVYVEFPEPTENDYQIKKEVKDILTKTTKWHLCHANCHHCTNNHNPEWNICR